MQKTVNKKGRQSLHLQYNEGDKMAWLGERKSLQTSDDDDYVDDDNGENEDSADNDDSIDGDNSAINGEANDLVQSVEILCGLAVKVEPPDASEQLLNVRVEKKTQSFFAPSQDNDT